MVMDRDNVRVRDGDDSRKLFVGGLGWETTSDSLVAYFSQYGTVVDVDIKKDQVTKKPRGFGFVLFESADAVEKVLACPKHEVDKKSIDPKPAIAQKKPEKKKKIFIGGIGSELKDDQIKEYFSKFGTVTETEFPEDKNTGRRQGFAFVTFETSDQAQDAQRQRFHTIGSKKVEVSEAVSREERQAQKMRGAMGGMRGRRGGFGPGFRGGYSGYGGYEDPSYGGYHGYGGGGYAGGYGGGGGPGGFGGQGGGYQGYGGGNYDQYGGYGGQGYSGYGGGQGGGGGYGDFSGGGGYSGGYNSGGGGGGYGGYNSGYEQSGPGKAPVNRRGGGAHHPYSR